MKQRDDREDLEVACYAGYKGDEYPRSFRLGENRRDVREVLDRWYGPDDSYFKVRADDGNEYILRRTAEGTWSLAAFRRERVS